MKDATYKSDLGGQNNDERSTPKARDESEPRSSRHLLHRDAVLTLLQLTNDQVQHLVDTKQLQPIRIVGQERFCSIDLGNLIDTYRHVAARRTR